MDVSGGIANRKLRRVCHWYYSTPTVLVKWQLRPQDSQTRFWLSLVDICPNGIIVGHWERPWSLDPFYLEGRDDQVSRKRLTLSTENWFLTRNWILMIISPNELITRQGAMKLIFGVKSDYPFCYITLVGVCHHIWINLATGDAVKLIETVEQYLYRNHNLMHYLQSEWGCLKWYHGSSSSKSSI